MKKMPACIQSQLRVVLVSETVPRARQLQPQTLHRLQQKLCSGKIQAMEVKSHMQQPMLKKHKAGWTIRVPAGVPEGPSNNLPAIQRSLRTLPANKTEDRASG